MLKTWRLSVSESPRSRRRAIARGVKIRCGQRHAWRQLARNAEVGVDRVEAREIRGDRGDIQRYRRAGRNTREDRGERRRERSAVRNRKREELRIAGLR